MYIAMILNVRRKELLGLVVKGFVEEERLSIWLKMEKEI